MSEYRMESVEPQDDGEDATPWRRLRVTRNGALFCFARIRMTGSLNAAGSLATVDRVTLFDTILVSEVEARLAAGLLEEGQGPLDVVLDWEDEGRVLSAATRPKDCKWLLPDQVKGDLCGAGKAGPDPTTPPLCATCDLPDSRVVCSALVHPAIQYNAGMSMLVGEDAVVVDPSRSIERAHCRVRLQMQDWQLCHASGNRCWHRLVFDGSSIPAADPEAPRRLTDAIPYLRLTYADRFGVKPSAFWPPIDERSVATMLAPCASATDLQHHVTALDTLITRMQPHGQLEEDRRKEGGTIGSITALGRVLEDRCGGDGLPYIGALRALHKSRNSYPAHAHSDDLQQAMRDLGLSKYPPDDWQTAWWQVATSVEQALTAIRVAIQSSGEGNDGD